MSVIEDRGGVRYVLGHYGPYPIDSLTWDENHNPIAAIDALLARLVPAHPDIDILLDARHELTQEQP